MTMNMNTITSDPTPSGNRPSRPQIEMMNNVKLIDNPNQPIQSTMTADDGFAKRPRDSRLIHMILASLGVSGYQERVPLQLMDFAYRYTSSTLQDALHLTSEGYGTQTAGTAKATNNNDMSTITVSSLRMSIASRTSYQFSPTFDKESYQKIALERNQVQLPAITKDWGVRLPPEQYCLTGVGWKLRNEFESAPGQDDGADNLGDQPMMDGVEDCDDDGAEDGNERMEDLFGEDVDGNEGDQEMGNG